MRVYKFLDEEFGRKSLQDKRLKISRIDDLNDPSELLLGGLYFLNFGENLHLAEVVLGVRCTIPKDAILHELGLAAKEVKVTKARAAHSTFEIVEDEEF